MDFETEYQKILSSLEAKEEENKNKTGRATDIVLPNTFIHLGKKFSYANAYHGYRIRNGSKYSKFYVSFDVVKRIFRNYELH